MAVCLREQQNHRLLFIDVKTMKAVKFKVGPERKEVPFLEEVVHEKSWLENGLPGISFMTFFSPAAPEKEEPVTSQRRCLEDRR